MITLGRFTVGIYQNKGITFSNTGSICFLGRAEIGNDSYVSVGTNSKVVFGNNFKATTTFRLTSQCGITFGENVRIGWDVLITDTDYHRLKKTDGTYSKGQSAIQIGSFNWFGNGCRILKGVRTPDYLTTAAGTWLTGPIDVPQYSVIGNEKKIKIIASGFWLDPEDCDF